MKCITVALTIALLVACQRDETDKRPATSAHPFGSEPRVGERLDVHGISVTFLDGGSIEVRGRDRWGQPLDTTYENRDFLRKALPVLERNITAEQANGLRTVIAK